MQWPIKTRGVTLAATGININCAARLIADWAKLLCRGNEKILHKQR
jgi:hypothetical protein